MIDKSSLDLDKSFYYWIFMGNIGQQYLLLKAGYSYIPYSSLESVIEKNKDAYYLAL